MIAPGGGHFGIMIAAALAGMAVAHAQTYTQTGLSACHFANLETAAVADIVDGRTVRLRDGRDVRLAGIEMTDGNAGAANAANDGPLAALKAVTTISVSAEGKDRYGRLLAYVFAGTASEPLQLDLVAQGYARVAPWVDGPPACGQELLTSESAARAAKLGRLYT